MRTTLAAVAAALVAAAALAGCAATSSEAAPARSSRATPAASPDPVAACTHQVTYWVGESLRAAPDHGFDYQHMGLSGATYEVVRRLTAEAHESSAPASERDAAVHRRALEECRVLKGPGASATPGAGTGWP